MKANLEQITAWVTQTTAHLWPHVGSHQKLTFAALTRQSHLKNELVKRSKQVRTTVLSPQVTHARALYLHADKNIKTNSVPGTYF